MYTCTCFCVCIYLFDPTLLVKGGTYSTLLGARDIHIWIWIYVFIYLYESVYLSRGVPRFVGGRREVRCVGWNIVNI